MFKLIMQSKIIFYRPISPLSKDIILKLLRKDYTKRLGY